MTDIRIVPYSPEHPTQVMALMGNTALKSRLWDWQFEQSPFGKAFDPVVAESDGEVVGFNGVMPVALSIGDDIREALWSCDFFVAEKVRGQGGGRLIKEALHTRAHIIMALGVSDQAAPVLERMGWRPQPCMQIWHRVKGIRNWREGVFAIMQVGNALRSGIKARSGPVQWLTQLPDDRELAGLWAMMQSGWPGVQVMRTPAYLHWKYAQHPLARYRYVVFGAPGRRSALLIVREQGESLYVVDYVGEHATDLKKALLQEVMRQYCDYRHILIASSDSQFHDAARSLGFYKGRHATRFYVYESGVQTPSLVSQPWFLMGGDSDGELLAAARAAHDTEEKQG